MTWKHDGATITEAKYNGTPITKGKFNGTEFFGTTPGGAVYQKFVDSGAAVLHGTFTQARTQDTNRVVFWPGDTNPIGTVIASTVPTGFPAMPDRMFWRLSGSHIGRLTHELESDTVNAAMWGHAADRFYYLCTISTSSGAHEFICLATGNTTSAGRIGGGSWINVYEGISPGNVSNNADRLNVREDLTAGYIDGQARTASNATAQFYRAWINRAVRLEAGDDPVEFVVAFATVGTIDPNA